MNNRKPITVYVPVNGVNRHILTDVFPFATERAALKACGEGLKPVQCYIPSTGGKAGYVLTDEKRTQYFDKRDNLRIVRRG